MATEEQKDTLQENENNAENVENNEFQNIENKTESTQAENQIISEEKNESSSEEESAEKKSWFDKLFQSNPSKLKEQLDELTAKNEEMKDKYLRLFADFDNYKKRTAKEKLELIDAAGKDFFALMLPVVDDFERSLKAINNTEANNALKEGIELVYHKLLKTLESKGVKAMESNGTEFNADLHEAITEIPAPSEEMKGKVIDTVEKGYYLNDKILRYAKVVVGK